MNYMKETKEFICYGFIKKDKAKISYIAVKPRYRKKGFGKKAVDEFISYCKTKKAFHISIDAHKKSLDFWRNIGFQLEDTPQIIGGIKQDYYDGILTVPNWDS